MESVVLDVTGHHSHSDHARLPRRPPPRDKDRRLTGQSPLDAVKESLP